MWTPSKLIEFSPSCTRRAAPIALLVALSAPTVNAQDAGPRVGLLPSDGPALEEAGSFLRTMGVATANITAPDARVFDGDGNVDAAACAKIAQHNHVTHVLWENVAVDYEDFGVATRASVSVELALIDCLTGGREWEQELFHKATAGSKDRALSKALGGFQEQLAAGWPELLECARAIEAWQPAPVVLLVEDVVPENRVQAIARLRGFLAGLSGGNDALIDYSVKAREVRIDLPWTEDLFALDLIVAEHLPELELVAMEDILQYRMLGGGSSLQLEFLGVAPNEALPFVELLDLSLTGARGVVGYEIVRDIARNAIEITLETAGKPLSVERELFDLIRTRGGATLDWTAVAPNPGFDMAYRLATASESWVVTLTQMTAADLGPLGSPLVDFLSQKGGAIQDQRFDEETRTLEIFVRLDANPQELRAAIWRHIAQTPDLARIGIGESEARRIGFRVLSGTPDDYQIELIITGLTQAGAADALPELADTLERMTGVRELSVNMESESVAARIHLRYPKAPPIFLADLLEARRIDDELEYVFVPAPATIPAVRLHFGDRVPVGDGEVSPADEKKPTATLADVVEGVEGTVVTIQANATDGSRWNGSGFVVSPRGYVLTNYHVAGSPEGLAQADVELSAFFFNGRSYEAQFVAGDPTRDLALLKLSGQGFEYAKLRGRTGLRRGDPLFFIGAPRGLSDSVTTGIISAFERENGWIQTDALINPGNSGGPAFTHDGEVCGVAVAGRVQRYNSNSGVMVVPDPGLNFLIPIEQAREMLKLAGIQL
jgi:hypothetical protein